MAELDVYWTDISAVFGLTKLFGPPLTPSGEAPSKLSEKTCHYLQSDKEMAMFVEDFVLDSYNIMLRETIVPKFWSHFKTPETKPKMGFDKFCKAVECLHNDYQELAIHTKELQSIREMCNTHRTLYGQRTVSDLLSIALKATLHSQLDQVPTDWQNLVKQFYSQYFCCYKNDGWTGDASVASADDSGDWNDGICCQGCSVLVEMCQCQHIRDTFQLTTTRMSELGLLEKLTDKVIIEIVQEEIDNHVQESCKGSFDISHLEILEEWLDRVVMTWLAAARIKTFSRKKLLSNLYHTYTKERIEEMYNIIIEWPESQPALEEIRNCMGRTDLRGHLTKSLKEVLDNKLLHPGVNTSDILSAYIASIKALINLDPSGVVLQIVCEDVRKYLKSREDTVRCIVEAFKPESSSDSELYEELKKDIGLYLETGNCDPEDLEDENWDKWEPDPIDAPSKNNRRTSDIISMLVNIYGSKELFVNEYRNLLSNRLLAHCQYAIHDELRNLEFLKKRFGETPLHQCDVMLKDIGDSQRINNALHSEEGGCHELLNQQFQVNALILSAQFWPQLKNETLELPDVTIKALEVYNKAFQKLKGNRTLVWKPNIGFANLDLEIGNKIINLTVSPMHASIICKFEEAEEWNTEQLANSLKVPVSTLKRKLTFWQSQGIIYESSPDVFCLVGDETAGVADVSVIGVDDDQEDSATASLADQREEEFEMFWKYTIGMLTARGGLPFESISASLRIFAADVNTEDLRRLLDMKVRQHQLIFSGGEYRLPK